MKLNANISKCLLLASQHNTAHLPSLSLMLDGNAIEQITTH